MKSTSKQRNPYMGLSPFRERDRYFFFGRGNEVTELLQIIHSSEFCALVGFSGTGKSSIMYAGVLPALKESLDPIWQIICFKPRNSPLKNFIRSIVDLYPYLGRNHFGKRASSSKAELVENLYHEAIRDSLYLRSQINLNPDEKILIFIDQFEEIFQRPYDEAQYFLNIVLSLANENIHVLVATRSDQLDNIIVFDDLPEVFSKNTYFLSRLPVEALIDAIIAPAKMGKKKIDSNLVGALIKKTKAFRDHRKRKESTKDKDDSLPILQHALSQLWNQNTRTKVLGLKQYHRLGFFDTILEEHLEDLFESLPLSAQKITEFIFKTISRQDQSKRIFRRTIDRNELVQMYREDCPKEKSELEKSITEVLSKFSKAGNAFLQVEEREKTCEITVVHEAVFRNWPRCLMWIGQERELKDMVEDVLSFQKDSPQISPQRINEIIVREPDLIRQYWLSWVLEEDAINKIIKKIKYNLIEMKKRLLVHWFKEKEYYFINKIITENSDAPPDEQIELTPEDFDRLVLPYKDLYYAIYPEKKKVLLEKEDKNRSVQESGDQNFEFNKQTKIPADHNLTTRETRETGVDKDWLLNIEIDANTYPLKFTVLHYAALAGNFDHFLKPIADHQLGLLEQEIAELKQRGYTQDELKASNKKRYILLKETSNGYTPFSSAIYGNQIETAKKIIKYILDNYYKNLPTQARREKKRELVFKEFSDGKNSIHLAAQKGCLELLKWLISKKGMEADLLSRGQLDTDVVGYATLENRFGILQYLLKQKKLGYQNYRIKDGYSLGGPLHIACKYKSLESLRYLLRHFRANLTKDAYHQIIIEEDSLGFYPMVHALMNLPEGWQSVEEKRKISFFQLASVLLQYGYNLKHQNQKKRTIFSYAAEWGKYLELRWLIRKSNKYVVGDLINLQDDMDKTPLHYAIENSPSFSSDDIDSDGIDYYNCIRLLVTKGSDINCRNKEGDTPFHLAIKHGSPELIQLLLDFGADTHVAYEAAIKYGGINSLDLIFEHSEDQKPNGNKPNELILLDYYANHRLVDKNEETVRWLIDHGANHLVELENTKAHSLESFIKASINKAKKSGRLEGTGVNLPFYKEGRLYVINNIFKERPDLELIYIQTKNKNSIFNGNSSPLHELNRESLIELTDEIVPDYLAFFCSNINSTEGTFSIISDLSEVRFANMNEKEEKKFSAFVRSALEHFPVKEVARRQVNNDLYWEVKALVLYGSGLYGGHFKVKSGGMIEMQADIPLLRSFNCYNLHFKGGIRALIQNEASNSTVKWMNFVNASALGFLEIMKWQLEYDENLDINAIQKLANHQDESINSLTSSALIIAAQLGYDKIVDWLLTLEQIHLDLRDSEGKTALVRAEENQHEHIVKTLKKAQESFLRKKL